MSLKGTKNFYDYDITPIVAYNVREWLNYGLLEKGAFTVVKFNLPTSGYCNLQRVQDERFGGSGRVFEGLGPSWVWENDVSVPSGMIQPFQVSGVYINTNFVPISSSGQFAHIIDYQNGRVIFNSTLPANTLVQAEYTFRDISIFLSDSYEWKTLQDEYWNRYDEIGMLSPSGIAQVLKDRRIWFPGIGIKVINRESRGLQLGGGEITSCDVEYHIFSDKSFSASRLADIINNQRETTLSLFDLNSAPVPLSYDGSLASGALSYKVLSDRNTPYFWTYGYIVESENRTEGLDGDTYRIETLQTMEISRYLSTY